VAVSGRWRNINARELLDQVNTNDLSDFLVQYARKHPDFIYKLIARFAPRISIMEESEKYEFLFFKSIHYYLPGRQNPTKVRIQNLRVIYDTLAEHAKDFISLQQYVEAFEIIRFGIIYTKLLVKRVYDTIHYEAAHESYVEFHKLLGQLINSSLPPPLIDKIRDYCIEESLVYDYFAPDEDFNLYNIAFRLLYDAEQVTDYMGQITGKLTDTSFISLDHSHAKKSLVESALKWENYELLTSWADEKLIHQDEWESILKSSLGYSRRKEAIHLAILLLPKLSNLFKERLLVFIVENTSASEDVELLMEMIDKLLEISYNIKLVYSLLPVRGIDNPKSKLIKDRIEIAVQKWNEPGQTVEWLILQGEFDEALDKLNLVSNADQLVTLTGKLPEAHKKKAGQILNEKVDEFLESSFGPLGAKRVQEVVNSLRKNDMYRLADGLVDHVKETFPRRKSLNGIR
jgi:hypothetical protein